MSTAIILLTILSLTLFVLFVVAHGAMWKWRTESERIALEAVTLQTTALVIATGMDAMIREGRKSTAELLREVGAGRDLIEEACSLGLRRDKESAHNLALLNLHNTLYLTHAVNLFDQSCIDNAAEALAAAGGDPAAAIANWHAHYARDEEGE